jgi:hypothetical protein|tara:strand:- start:385 stop:750 length:366 start_codon:yes stop_codon:yes gene_type:complete
MDVGKYLLICEQLGEEPDPERMPLEASAFPAEVQVAFLLYGYLSDVWEGMSGSYMGKNWNSVELLFNVYEIEDRKTTLQFMKMYEAVVIRDRAEDQERKRKAEDRKRQQGAGKTYTHNVKG